MIGGPARRQRLHSVKPQIGQIERVDKQIDRANRIALFNPVTEAFRQQRVFTQPGSQPERLRVGTRFPLFPYSDRWADIPESSVRAINDRFAPQKSSEPFRRRPPLKSVTDLAPDACYYLLRVACVHWRVRWRSRLDGANLLRQGLQRLRALTARISQQTCQ
jgi:hypothetical protein